MDSEKGLIFFPMRELEGTPGDYQLAYEETFFPAADGTSLHGWFVPSSNPREKTTLLWFHGNAGNISHRLENLALLHRHLDISILVFDYREFGRSAGSISKAGTFLDARGAWDYLVGRRRIEPADILLFGRSLGTALAVDLATQEPCLGVVLEAAFTSSYEMLKPYFPWGIPPELTRTTYDNLGKIHLLRAPVLFIHAENDEAIPMEMAERLLQAARPPKDLYVVPHATHNDTYMAGGTVYFHRWSDFIHQCRAP